MGDGAARPGDRGRGLGSWGVEHYSEFAAKYIPRVSPGQRDIYVKMEAQSREEGPFLSRLAEQSSRTCYPFQPNL